ncbi:hypothetical protein SESBI_49733 [Sesbania bispinosa]|nr:hypothetical protein SESBI_49733 [Sesbania bispinosa]
MLSWGTTKLDDLVEDKVRREKSSEVSKDCLAVIPWVAFHSPMVCEEIVPESDQPLDEKDGEMMEMDESCVNPVSITMGRLWKLLSRWKQLEHHHHGNNNTV